MATKFGNAPFQQNDTDTDLTFPQLTRAVGLFFNNQAEPLHGKDSLASCVMETKYVEISPGRQSISFRHRSAWDRRRLLFRTLAQPGRINKKPSKEETESEIVHITYYKYETDDTCQEGDTGCIVVDEDERRIDVLDALVSISGEPEPLRNSLCSIALDIPRQNFYLHQLQVPYSRLLELLKLLLLAQFEGLGNHIQQFLSESATVAQIAEFIMASFTCQREKGIGWQEFDAVVERSVVSSLDFTGELN